MALLGDGNRARRRPRTIQEGIERTGDVGVATANEQRLHPRLGRRQLVHGDPTFAPGLGEHTSGQQRYAEAGRDAADDRVEGAEFEPAQVDDSASRHNLFEALAVGAAGAQNHDLGRHHPRKFVDPGDGRRGGDGELLREDDLRQELRMSDRPTDESVLDQAALGARLADWFGEHFRTEDTRLHGRLG